MCSSIRFGCGFGCGRYNEWGTKLYSKNWAVSSTEHQHRANIIINRFQTTTKSTMHAKFLFDSR
ncbi:unnamed protein product [Periconia digitata]|uniref:Uncharacterized protein n=1 Tax=Periconia digitata TaxID=1303443 RepID=A0A9W4UJ01_9PLEO|nr:unnamed protein product [Periconia digitata]